MFQKDNCSYHKLRLATVLFDKHSSGMPIMNWPLKNPEFYPIEKGVKEHCTRTVLASVSEIRTALAVVCQAMTVEQFLKVV